MLLVAQFRVTFVIRCVIVTDTNLANSLTSCDGKIEREKKKRLELFTCNFLSHNDVENIESNFKLTLLFEVL